LPFRFKAPKAAWLFFFVRIVLDQPGSCSSKSRFSALRKARPAILPSLLLCDFTKLGEEVARLEQTAVAGLHLDVMDGHFVPNLTYGPPIVAAVRSCTDLPIDVHLMISNPQRYVKEFVEAGADSLTIHIEAVADPKPVLRQIRSLGAAAGLAVNPPTALAAAEPFLDDCDLVLIMSVMPGFGGQEFDPIALNKLRAMRSRSNSHLPIEVDGGINNATIGGCAEAGATHFVIGSAIFRQPDYSTAVAGLRERAQLTAGATIQS
jgi:ribulose-phosphate 3-epimerase